MLQFHERHRLIWDSNLTSTQKFILFAYDSYGDSQGESIYPSYNTIATKTSYTRRTVIDTVHKLCELGVMGKLHRLKDGGGMTSNRYKIYFQKLAGSDRNSPGSDPNSPGSDRNSPGSDPGSPDQSSYLSNDQFIDQKKKKPGKTRTAFSEISKFQDSDQNLENPDLDKKPNLIPDQQELNDRDPEKKESSAKERNSAPPVFAPQPPENTPIARGGGLWDINYLNEIWKANKAPKWKTSSLMFLSSEIQYGLEQFLLKAGGDRAEAYRLIGISIAEMSRDEFYGSRSRMLGEVIGLDPSKPCKTYCGNWLGAAIDRDERAVEENATKTIVAPVVPNHFSGWDT